LFTVFLPLSSEIAALTALLLPHELRFYQRRGEQTNPGQPGQKQLTGLAEKGFLPPYIVGTLALSRERLPGVRSSHSSSPRSSRSWDARRVLSYLSYMHHLNTQLAVPLNRGAAMPLNVGYGTSLQMTLQS
jgi:hypothetical protein